MQEAQRISLHVVTTTPLNDRPDFLASLDQQQEKSFQVVQVEQSTGKVGSIIPMYPGLDLIHLRMFRDAGVAHAHNQAIALALSRWSPDVLSDRFIALCRPEVAFDTQCLAQILSVFDRHPELMVLSPKILLGRAEYVGEGEWLEMSMTNQIYSLGCQLKKDRTMVLSGEGREDVEDDLEIRPAFLLHDACVVFRASALHRLQEGEKQWLDERMPTGQEIWDLVWRAQRLELGVAVATRARVWFAPSERGIGRAWRWRERYITGPLRAKHDQWMMQVMHFPWFFPSLMRSFFDMLSHPRYWRRRAKSWTAWRRSPLRKRLSSAKPCTIAAMRRWFI